MSMMCFALAPFCVAERKCAVTPKSEPFARPTRLWPPTPYTSPAKRRQLRAGLRRAANPSAKAGVLATILNTLGTTTRYCRVPVVSRDAEGYFLRVSLARLIGYASRLWTPTIAHYFALSLPKVASAILLGRWLNHRLRKESFVRLTHAGLIALAAILVAQTFLK